MKRLFLLGCVLVAACRDGPTAPIALEADCEPVNYAGSTVVVTTQGDTVRVSYFTCLDTVYLPIRLPMIVRPSYD